MKPVGLFVQLLSHLPPKMGKTIQPRWPGRTILIAEDEPINYMLIHKILENTEARIRWVKNGREAVDDVEKECPDLILMDIRMPEMDGITATKLIHKKHPAVPVIALTAFNLSDEVEQCRKAGCIEFITKPVMPKVLLGTLNLIFKLNHEETKN